MKTIQKHFYLCGTYFLMLVFIVSILNHKALATWTPEVDYSPFPYQSVEDVTNDGLGRFTICGASESGDVTTYVELDRQDWYIGAVPHEEHTGDFECQAEFTQTWIYDGDDSPGGTLLVDVTLKGRIAQSIVFKHKNGDGYNLNVWSLEKMSGYNDAPETVDEYTTGFWVRGTGEGELVGEEEPSIDFSWTKRGSSTGVYSTGGDDDVHDYFGQGESAWAEWELRIDEEPYEVAEGTRIVTFEKTAYAYASIDTCWDYNSVDDLAGCKVIVSSDVTSSGIAQFTSN